MPVRKIINRYGKNDEKFVKKWRINSPRFWRPGPTNHPKTPKNGQKWPFLEQIRARLVKWTQKMHFYTSLRSFYQTHPDLLQKWVKKWPILVDFRLDRSRAAT